MEYGKIEREIVIDASPATVFEVITSPEHLTQWWPDEAVVEPTPGAVGELVFGDRSSGDAQIPREHVEGWDYFLPRLTSYAPTVGVAS